MKYSFFYPSPTFMYPNKDASGIHVMILLNMQLLITTRQYIFLYDMPD